MSQIEIRITDEKSAHLAEGGQEFGPELLKLLDAELTWFDDVLMHRVEPTVRGLADKYERAAIKTFLYHKIVDDHRRRRVSGGG